MLTSEPPGTADLSLIMTVYIPAHLVLIRFVAQVFDQTLHTFCCRTLPVGPGLWAKSLVPDQETTQWLRINQHPTLPYHHPIYTWY